MDNKNAAGELVLDTEGNPMEIGAHYATEGEDDNIYLGQDPENRDDMVFRSPFGFMESRKDFRMDKYKRRSDAKLVNKEGRRYRYLSYDYAKGGKKKTKRRKTKRRKTRRRR